jgi:DNA polymerase III epsilon subunit-like protein
MISELVALYERGQRFVVLDVETLGLIGEEPYIIEIGAVEAGFAYEKQYRTFQRVLKVTEKNLAKYQEALKVNKISPAEIRKGVSRRKAFREFLQFISGAILICHTNFDLKALHWNLQGSQEFTAFLDQIDEMLKPLLVIGKEAIPQSRYFYFNTVDLVREVLRSNSCSLARLVEELGVENPQPHRALSDALTTKLVVQKLLTKYFQRRPKRFNEFQAKLAFLTKESPKQKLEEYLALAKLSGGLANLSPSQRKLLKEKEKEWLKNERKLQKLKKRFSQFSPKVVEMAKAFKTWREVERKFNLYRYPEIKEILQEIWAKNTEIA